VVNLLGKVFMKDEPVGCPFNALEKITHKFNGEKDIIIVDMHAETTSEKHAIAQYFDGKVTAVLGTHTHVPTADERILTNGTALISDVGMVGYYDSVIGARKDQVFNLFLGHGETSRKHDLPDTGECQFDAVYLEINAKTRKATKIKRINKIIDIK
ncbi:MAG: YmdB family metallophosphoesterase, partial [bacterium]